LNKEDSNWNVVKVVISQGRLILLKMGKKAMESRKIKTFT